jgi:phosphoglucosamine mutase
VSLRFGTDGVRGVANTELTPELALALGRAAAHVLPAERIVIGRDTRRSGSLIESALAAGLASAGVDVERLGVVPTPAVAYVAQREGVPGAMISASHNPFADNGIKLFGPGGRKLGDGVEELIEQQIEAVLAGGGGDRPVAERVGTLVDRPDEVGAYADHLVAVLEGRQLTGVRVAIDCANGATWALGPHVFERLGAEVVAVGNAPDGTNINARCGATHPDALAAVVAEGGFDLGLAFDGDGDRCIAVDHTGAVVDGDHIIAICALDLRTRGALVDDTVVVTVMTNLGFRQAMQRAGVTVVETAVGDRYVLEVIERDGYAIGGEQSGHVIFPAHATTGDGILTGLVLADIVARNDRPLADLSATAMTRLPQVLVNLRVEGSADEAVRRASAAVRAAEAALGERGRVLVRASGTEPLVRVMVEAPTDEEARRVADDIAAAIQSPNTPQ